MAAMLLHSEYPTTTTTVSNRFIDEFMPGANGEFVKVYLYLLRCMNASMAAPSVSAIADLFEHTENDVTRALKYWEKVNLIRLEYGTDKAICGVCFLNPDASGSAVGSFAPDSALNAGSQQGAAVDSVPGSGFDSASRSNTGAASALTAAFDSQSGFTAGAASDSGAGFDSASRSSAGSASVPGSTSGSSSAAAEASSKAVSMVSAALRGETAPATLATSKAPAKKQYTLDEIKAFRKNEDISELFFIVETYLKHQLTTTDTNTILYWHETLHFSTELIVYLVEYCISKGHSSLRYMDKVALGWSDSNITTVTQAKENTAAHSQAYYTVMKSLGIAGRNLVENEVSYIKKWTKDYAFDLEIIQEACKRTIIAIHQPSFEYADSILSSWNKNHVHTLKDIEKLDATYNRAKKTAPNNTNTTAPSSKNKFNNFKQREYDEGQLQEMLLSTSTR